MSECKPWQSGRVRAGRRGATVIVIFSGTSSANSVFPGWRSFPCCVAGHGRQPRPAEQQPLSSPVCKAAHCTGAYYISSIYILSIINSSSSSEQLCSHWYQMYYLAPSWPQLQSGGAGCEAAEAGGDVSVGGAPGEQVSLQVNIQGQQSGSSTTDCLTRHKWVCFCF